MSEESGIPNRIGEFVLVGRYWIRISDGLLVPVIQGGGPSNTVQNDKYAFGDDDGTESGHSLDTENTNRTAQSADVTFMIRIQIEETAGGTESDGYMLYAQKNGTGGFIQVPYSSTNNGLRLNDDTQSRADDENTTERLSYGGSSSFQTGHYDDGTTAVGTGSFSLDQDNTGYTDLEFAIYIDSANASNGDYWELRVHFDGGGALDGYPGSYPTVTASITASVTIPLDTAVVNANGQATTIVPGAVTKSLNTATITAGGQATTIVPGVATIGLNTAAATVSGQNISFLMGEATTGLNTASLTAGGQNITVSLGGGAQTIPLFTATLAASGQAITLAPGEATIGLNTASVTAGGQALTVVPGAVAIPLDTAVLLADAQTLEVIREVILQLGTGQITAGGQNINVVLGGVVVSKKRRHLLSTYYYTG